VKNYDYDTGSSLFVAIALKRSLFIFQYDALLLRLKDRKSIGSRFCLQCGEPLWLLWAYSRNALSHCEPVRQGGFGRTYLAEDLHRFNERCVLKEFAPKL